ncbi:MAG: hypothetical protein MHMPM18_001973 [Marteilia pararefringens]
MCEIQLPTRITHLQASHPVLKHVTPTLDLLEHWISIIVLSSRLVSSRLLYYLLFPTGKMTAINLCCQQAFGIVPVQVLKSDEDKQKRSAVEFILLDSKFSNHVACLIISTLALMMCQSYRNGIVKDLTTGGTIDIDSRFEISPLVLITRLILPLLVLLVQKSSFVGQCRRAALSNFCIVPLVTILTLSVFLVSTFGFYTTIALDDVCLQNENMGSASTTLDGSEGKEACRILSESFWWLSTVEFLVAIEYSFVLIQLFGLVHRDRENATILRKNLVMLERYTIKYYLARIIGNLMRQEKIENNQGSQESDQSERSETFNNLFRKITESDKEHMQTIAKSIGRSIKQKQQKHQLQVEAAMEQQRQKVQQQQQAAAESTATATSTAATNTQEQASNNKISKI